MHASFGKEYIFIRSDDICPPQDLLLLDNVIRNNCEGIKKLLQDNNYLLSHIYEESKKPILLEACTNVKVRSETIQVLIEEGADLYYVSEKDDDWQPLHFLAGGTHSGKLKVIVDNLEPGRINDLAKGSNALHILLTYGDSNKRDEFLQCANILINAGIDLNREDANNVSPILLAAVKGFKDIVTAILENGVVRVDIDTSTYSGKTARQWIIAKQLYDKTLPERYPPEDHNNDPVDILFNYLLQNKVYAFINYNNGDIRQYVNCDNGSHTLLQYCCEYGFKKAVKHLLKNGADHKKVTNKNDREPIQIAAECGFYEIFTSLLECPHEKIPSKTFFHLVDHSDKHIFLMNKHDTYDTINHRKCYEAIMDKLKYNKKLLNVNDQDQNSNTVLHYAIKYADPKTSHEVLALGASLAIKNKFGKLPVEDMEPSELEKHLDNCIEFVKDRREFDRDDFIVTFNYRSLMLPQKHSYKIAMSGIVDAEGEKTSITSDFSPEMVVVSYLSQSAKFKHLLKHPVITSFLFMKWYKIRWLFYINSMVHIIFALSLLSYIFLPSGYLVISEALYCLLFITYAMLVLREIFQVLFHFKKYLTDFENGIEISLMIIVGCIIFPPLFSDDLKKQLSSLAILFTAFELVLLLGKHPLFSTYVVMLKTVSHNFFKFFMWYSLLILAFALSFFNLFSNASDDLLQHEAKNNQSAAEEDENGEFFVNPGTSVFKTIVMLTGEYSLNFHTFSVISRLIFILFVFMIAIVLVNLLTGLAVSDTQKIKNDAELIGHIARAEHIEYVETMSLGHIVPVSAIRILRYLSSWLSINYDTNYIITSLARRVCIFPDFLNYELSIYLNKQGKVHIHNYFSRSELFHNIFLDKTTIKRTRDRMQIEGNEQKLQVNVETKQDEDILSKLEKKIGEIENHQTELKDQVDIMINYMYIKWKNERIENSV